MIIQTESLGTLQSMRNIWKCIVKRTLHYIRTPSNSLTTNININDRKDLVSKKFNRVEIISALTSTQRLYIGYELSRRGTSDPEPLAL